MSNPSAPERLVPQSSPPEAWEPLLQLARVASRPLDRFLGIQAASGVLLLVAALVALVWANSPWSEGYLALWRTPVGVRLGGFVFERSLEWVVNDGLMVIFFFVVGLEIRREVHHGELAEWRRAALPMAAALGGMLVPAGLYLALARGAAARDGWGVPMATDIAFAVGVLALLGKRVPAAMRVLLLALAVIDDLGAILVIAIFYSTGIELGGLGVAALGFGGIFGLRWLGVRNKAAYVVPGIVVWGGIYAAGIHPTIAGVLIGVATPVRAWLGPDGFIEGMKAEADRLSRREVDEHAPHELARSAKQVNLFRREAMSPAESLIELLHPWVAYGIMPIFALANAGVVIATDSFDGVSTTVVLGILVGLVVGKPLGVVLASGITLKTGIGTLPVGMTMRHVVVLGLVAGVGFTMSLFIAQLAFAESTLLPAAKLAVLLASGAASALAFVTGRLSLGAADERAASTADEAECSTVL